MKPVDVVRYALSVPKHYTQPVSPDNSDKIIVLAHKSWLSSLFANCDVPDFILHESLSGDEVEAALLLGREFSLPWQRILVQIIPKPKGSALCLPRPRTRHSNEETGLSYPQLLHYVSHTNYQNQWKHQYKKYLGDKARKGTEKVKPVLLEDAGSILKKTIHRFYGSLEMEKNALTATEDFQAHVNVLPAVGALETDDQLLVLHPLKSHTTLRDFVLFSPAVFQTDISKPLFIICQLLNVLRDTHDRSLILGDLRLEDIFISDDLFVQVVPRVKSNIFLMSPPELELLNVPRPPVDGSLAALSRQWIRGDLSNYHYLLHLNAAAGRRFGNPSCHFVLPWVSDMSTKSSGIWRDLSRSKFRLNKGDRQLDLTYENATVGQVSHHVTDVLSEITYYVYQARRTPKAVLCKYVRPTWVPAEYPASIQRLYAWTPDECIPEFYSDPSVFKSIHEDLEDLELPSWSRTPEDFIDEHMNMLESRRVSDKLHHWIDLTFGYKLTGLPAVKAKNVCLHLASGHTSLCTSGVVQVFTQPHPRRQGPLSNFDKQPPRGRKIRISPEETGHHSSDAEDDDGGDPKVSPLLLHKFLSISRTSLLAPFQSTSDEATGVKSSALSNSSVERSGLGLGIATGKATRSVVGLDNPCGLLSAVESAYVFHMQTFGVAPTDPPQEPSTVKHKKMVATKRLQEMQVLGCLITEIFLYSSIRIQASNAIDERIAACRRQLTNESLPYCVRPVVRLLLDNYPPITDVGLPPPSAHQILQPLLSSFLLPLPPSMMELYAAVSRLKYLERFEHAAEFRMKMFADDLVGILNIKTIELIMPFVKNSLEDRTTTEATITYVLNNVLSYLSKERTNEYFLDTLLSLYERNPPDIYLYQKRFLLILMVRCGLKVFLNNVVVLIVEAAGRIGCHTALSGVICEEDDQSQEVEEKQPVVEPCPEVGVFSFDREDTPSDGESLQNLMEHLTGTSDDEDGDSSTDVDHVHGLTSPSLPTSTQGCRAEAVTTIECEVGSKGSDVTNQAQLAQSCDEPELLGPQPTPQQVHEVAADSILWLSRRLGPVLTAKYVMRNLLKMLTLCYTGPGPLASCTILPDDDLGHWKQSVARNKLVGDDNADRVLFCLKKLVDLYGEQLILVQYLPFMSDLISISKKKLTYSVEGGIVSSLALLQQVVTLLSDSSLMDNIQDVILKDIIHPLVRLMISTRHPFPSGYLGRLALTTKLLDALYILAVHIGADMTRVHLAVPSLQRFFLAFDKAVGLRLELDDGDKIEDGNTGDELRRVFSPSLAHSAYLAFFRLLGESNMKSVVVNHDLVRRLCILHEKQSDTSIKPKTELLTMEGKEGAKDGVSFCSSVAVVGNKIELKGEPSGNSATTHRSKFKDNSRHVRGNWLAYWEHEIGRSEKDTRFNFKQIKLQTFAGHSHAVRCLEVLDNENSLVSGSRDKTVKLWSLRSQGDGSAVSQCQFTYNSHRKSIMGVAYLAGPRMVASCDAILHLWDPFVGRTVSVVDGKSPCTALRALDTILISGTSDSSLRIVDARTSANVAEHKISWTPGGIVRCICVSRDGVWVAVGQSSGHVAVLGLRNAVLMAYWKAHEGEVLQVAVVDKNTLLSSSLDQTLSLWNVHDGKLRFHLKGPTEPVHCLKTHGNELITGTTANRIGVHTAMDAHAGFSSIKLRSDTFKGVLTSMAVLPLNMQLLLGADNGNIVLLC